MNDTENKVYMAIGVEQPYSSDDAYAIWDFVRDGGNLIIADDFGHGDSLWGRGNNDVAGEVEFYRKQLFDQNYVKNTKFVWVGASLNYEQGNFQFKKDYDLLLNEPSALNMKSSQFSPYIVTLAQSSEHGWLDDNNNGVRDPTEDKKTYDVVVYISNPDYKGKVIIISDPGLFINDNWRRMDNEEFIQDILSYLLPNGGEVIFDESRHINQNSFENSRHVLYSGLVYLTSSFWIIIIVAIVLVSGTLVVGAKIKPQKQWRNRNLLKIKHLNVLFNPHMNSSDYSQVYNTFLEKVRLGYGFSAEEFSKLDYNTLYKLIDDDYLYDFIIQRLPSYQDENYYRFITQRIIAWEPGQPSEDEYNGRKKKSESCNEDEEMDDEDYGIDEGSSFKEAVVVEPYDEIESTDYQESRSQNYYENRHTTGTQMRGYDSKYYMGYRDTRRD